MATAKKATKKTATKAAPKKATKTPAAKKAAPSKKTPVKPVAKKATKVTTKAPAKKTAKKITRAKVSKKTTAAKKTYTPRGTYNEHGYRIGTDSAIISEMLVAGGKDKISISKKCSDVIARTTGLETKGGKPKNVSSLVSTILLQMKKRGYTIESTWILQPPA